MTKAEMERGKELFLQAIQEAKKDGMEYEDLKTYLYQSMFEYYSDKILKNCNDMEIKAYLLYADIIQHDYSDDFYLDENLDPTFI